MAVGLHMQVQYTRQRLSGTEDVAVTTHDFWSPSANDFTTPWITAIKDAYLGFWGSTGVATMHSNSCILREFRFYDDYNGDGSPGEADTIIASSLAGGTGANMLPPQVACSITELLGPDSRKHWGRFYLPGPSANALAADGTFSTAYVDGVATAAENLYDAWTTTDYYPIVWVAGTPGFNPVQVQQVRVDNIPDIIRRRRYQFVTHRVTRNVE